MKVTVGTPLGRTARWRARDGHVQSPSGRERPGWGFAEDSTRASFCTSPLTHSARLPLQAGCLTDRSLADLLLILTSDTTLPGESEAVSVEYKAHDTRGSHQILALLIRLNAWPTGTSRPLRTLHGRGTV